MEESIMENKYVVKLRGEIFKALDIVRGEIEIEEATKLAMGISLLVLKGEDKEKLLNLRNLNANDLKHELLNAAHQLENSEKYRDIFSDFCFNGVERIPVITMQRLFISILDIIRKFEDEDEFGTYLFRYLTSSDLKGKQSGDAKEPEWLRKLTCKVADIKDGQIVLDPFVGEAGFFSTTNLVYNNPDVKYYGIEQNLDSYYRARINMLLQKNDNCSIYKQDSLMHPLLENSALVKFDRVITNPPIGLRHPMYDELIRDEYARFRYGVSSRGINDWLCIQSAIASTKDDGKAVVITSKGPLFRSNEAKIRKDIINDDILEAIIELPSNLLAWTSLPLVILVFNKKKPVSLKNKLLYIDASELGEKRQRPSKLDRVGRKLVISSSNLKQIEDIYFNVKEVDNVSYIISRDEIAANDFSLNIADRYKKLAMNNSLEGYVKLEDQALEVIRGVQVAPELLAELNKSDDRTHYFINLSNIVDGKIKVDDNCLIEPQMKWIKNYQVMPGDLLIAARGTFKCAVVADNLPPSIASGNLIIIRLGKGYSAHVLKYFFESEIGRQLIVQMQSGVTASIINPAKFKDIMIPNIPPTKQQELAKLIVDSDHRYQQMLKEAEDLLSIVKKELNKEMNLINI